MPISRHRWAALAAPVVASAFLVTAAAPAFAADAYTIPMHQDLPVTATAKGVSNEDQCAAIPSTQDGWHFVLPTNGTTFTKLTVTFEPGGQQVINVFGPPSDKHAYAASAPGAKLVSASAEVVGGSVEWFNLSHTCPADVQPTPTKTTSASPSTSTSASASVSASASASATTTTSASASAKPSGSVSAKPSGSASSPAPSGSVAAAGGSTGGGDLAKTGSDAPIGLLATMAGALIAAGAVLLVRRRKAGATG
ncbi:LPXTG cell wall anchor domain-containing protein [Streptomyces sp. NPDC003042]